MTDGIIADETGAQRLIGYVLDVGRGDGRARCHLDLGQAHMNRHGVMHGGVGVAVLDNAMGVTASLTVDPAGRAPFLTVSLNVQFMAPARAGMRVTATGRVAGGGRQLLFVEGTLRDEEGGVIAAATGVFKRVPQDRVPGAE
ncbi:hypothetical protein BH23PSE1_BH23PSE1_07080 [soil metagenome]